MAKKHWRDTAYQKHLQKISAKPKTKYKPPYGNKDDYLKPGPSEGEQMLMLWTGLDRMNPASLGSVLVSGAKMAGTGKALNASQAKPAKGKLP